MKNRLFFFAAMLTGFVSSAQDTIHVAKDFDIVPLNRNAYIHITWTTLPEYGRFVDNGLIYINNNEAVIMDTPPNDSTSRILLNWIAATFPEVKIKAVIINHFHDDAIGGLRAFHEKGIASYANYLTNKFLKNDNIPRAQHTFTKELKLRIGKAQIINRFFGEAHSRDNIVTWIPAEKILFGGCMIKALNSGRGNLADANIKEWSKTVQQVKDAYGNAVIVIPGHGEKGGTDLLDYTVKMFEKDAQ